MEGGSCAGISRWHRAAMRARMHCHRKSSGKASADPTLLGSRRESSACSPRPTFCPSGTAPSVCESEKKCNRGIHCRQLVRRGPHLVFSFRYSRYAAVQSEQTKSRSRHQIKTQEAQCLRFFQKDLHIHVFDVSVQRSGPNVRGLSLNRATVAPAVVGSRSKRWWPSACPQ